MRSRTLLFIAIAILAVFTIVLIAATSATNGDSSEVFTTVPPEGRLISTTGWKSGNIKTSHHKQRFTKLSSRAITGPCYRVDEYKWGDSGTVTKIVMGLGHFRWCVGAQHPNRIANFSATFEHSETSMQLWRLNWVETSERRSWSSTWCTSNGSGPCYPVQYHFFRYKYQFIRGATVGGIELAQHATFYIQCTIRGDAPSSKGNHECYTGMNN